MHLEAVTVNPDTNTVYVVNYLDHNITVIDGKTNSVKPITLHTGDFPRDIAIDSNKTMIYVAEL